MKKPKRKRGKRAGKKDKSKLTCYNCKKIRHFACKCTKPKNVLTHLPCYNCFIILTIFVAKSFHLWIVDSGATHVIND